MHAQFGLIWSWVQLSQDVITKAQLNAIYNYNSTKLISKPKDTWKSVMSSSAKWKIFKQDS